MCVLSDIRFIISFWEFLLFTLKGSFCLNYTGLVLEVLTRLFRDYSAKTLIKVPTWNLLMKHTLLPQDFIY